jgi:hypothetical protein
MHPFAGVDEQSVQVIHDYLLDAFAPSSSLVPATPEARAQAAVIVRFVDIYYGNIMVCSSQPLPHAHLPLIVTLLGPDAGVLRGDDFDMESLLALSNTGLLTGVLHSVAQVWSLEFGVWRQVTCQKWQVCPVAYVA